MTSICFYCEFDSWLNTEQICMGANMICDPKTDLRNGTIEEKKGFEVELLIDTEGWKNRLE